MKALLNWLDDRTGCREFVHEALFERIPGGARWRYVWGSTLVFAFTVQAITGIFLWMAYSPSGQAAWESVYYIQHEMYGGWLLRGLHHFMAQAMVVLLALHLLQVVIDGAYRAPREMNFWLGLVLMKIVLGLSLTGYLLPWDQKGYWATRVATNLAGIVPLVGPQLQKIVVGGTDYGHHTLTRFFALHAGVLPAALVGFLVLHVALFRRHGIKAKEPLRRPEGVFWPDQVLKDAVACLAVLLVVLFFIFKPAILGETARDAIAQRPGDYLGAHLDAPADRANEYSAARPEWYFLFLFQFLKLFEGQGETGELLGAIVVPGAVMGLLFLMPIVGRWNLGHRFNCLLMLVLLAGVALLTGQALWDDNLAKYTEKPIAAAEGQHDHAAARFEASQKYLDAVREAQEQAERAVVLARAPYGIPTGGVVSLMRDDPFCQGPRLFRRYCASCHSHTNAAGEGIVASPSSAPDLGGFASRAWIAGLLDPQQISGPRYFGNCKHKEGDMSGFVKDTLASEPAEEVKKIVMALSADAALPAQREDDQKDASAIAEGRKLIAAKGCTDCHQYGDQGDPGLAPTLTGYGSHQWLLGMISNPAHDDYYRDTNDRMPAFAEHDDPEKNQLSPRELELIVRWLRGDWYQAAK